MYVAGGRDSVPPERLLKASLLMAFYTVRSGGLLCEQWATTRFSVDHSTFAIGRSKPG